MSKRLVAVALFAIGAAFQIPRTLTLAAADPLISEATFRDFFPPENGFRWSTDRSAIVFPDPGPGIAVRVELLLSAWRPPGMEGPRVVVRAGGRTVTSHPGPGAEVVTIETTTSGWWRSDLLVEIHSDIFEPGPGDTRRLGVRIEEARLVRLTPSPRMPPLGALAGTTLSSLLIAFILGRGGVTPRTAERAALLATIAIAVAYTFGRPGIAIGLWPLVLVLLGLAVAVRAAPRATRVASGIIAASLRAFWSGLSRLLDVHVVTLIVLATVLVAVAYRAPSRIDIDLGSGREAAVARGFGSFVGKGGERARWAPRGARLDLSDFGGGSAWKIEVSAALDGTPRDVAVLRAGDREMVASLEEAKWTQAAMSAAAPFGWRSGLVLTVPGGSDQLRIDRVSIERGAALPSIRVVLAVILGALLSLVASGSIGLPAQAGRVAAVLVLIGSAAAVATEPLAAIPFMFRFVTIIGAATFLAVGLQGVVTYLDGAQRPLPGPAVIAAAVTGFAAWLTATAFPYYRGGHFVFHSSIAEEIWKGRFLIYYLPYPGSMLSEQAQWGKIVMPHPALFQTLVSPLAALPRPWFYFAEKVFLALLFASLVLVAARVAARLAGPRAATFTAVLFASLVPGFQLLGLGHLMTILGVWGSSLALPWLMEQADELSLFRTWLTTAWIFTFCFLTYTAALLFTGAVLVWVIVISARSNLPRARSIFTMLLAACTFAFLLYYVHWTLPFLLQSVPKILGGAGLGGSAAEATPILSRLALEPGKLSYSYGSMLIPLAGALGLLLLPKSWDRLILLSWMGILFFVSGADVFFNFLLKHHYYVMLPVAVGLGTLAARIESRWGRAPAFALTLFVLALGLKTAMDVALGRIP